MKSIEVKTCKGNRKNISVRNHATKQSIESKYLGSDVMVNGSKETIMHIVFYGFK